MGKRDHGPGTRPDWLCRTCTSADGSPWKNFGSRSSCFKCRVDKGQSFKANVEEPPPRAPRTLAQRQVQQQRLAEKDSRVTKLQTELNRVKQLLKDKNTAHADHEPKDADGENMATEVFDFTVEELHAQRKLLKEQGKDDAHPGVAALTAQIHKQEELRLAKKPGHLRAARAEREVKACQNCLQAAVDKQSKLDGELAKITQKIDEQKALVQSAGGSLREAERRRDELYQSLSTAAEIKNPMVQGFADLVALAGVAPPEVLAKANATPEQLVVLLNSLDAWQRERAERAEAEAAAACSAVPVVAAPAPPPATEDEDDIDMVKEQVADEDLDLFISHMATVEGTHAAKVAAAKGIVVQRREERKSKNNKLRDKFAK